VVLDKVATVLKDEHAASFFCGSLSVICNEREAYKVLTILNRDFDNKVEMSPDGSYGFIFDFVA
jgi:hypothetical protein